MLRTGVRTGHVDRANVQVKSGVAVCLQATPYDSDSIIATGKSIYASVVASPYIYASFKLTTSLNTIYLIALPAECKRHLERFSCKHAEPLHERRNYLVSGCLSYGGRLTVGACTIP